MFKLNLADWVSIVSSILSLTAAVVIAIVQYKQSAAIAHLQEKQDEKNYSEEIGRQAREFILKYDSIKQLMPFCIVANAINKVFDYSNPMYREYCLLSQDVQSCILSVCGYKNFMLHFERIVKHDGHIFLKKSYDAKMETLRQAANLVESSVSWKYLKKYGNSGISSSVIDALSCIESFSSFPYIHEDGLDYLDKVDDSMISNLLQITIEIENEERAPSDLLDQNLVKQPYGFCTMLMKYIKIYSCASEVSTSYIFSTKRRRGQKEYNASIQWFSICHTIEDLYLLSLLFIHMYPFLLRKRRFNARVKEMRAK